MVSVQKWDFFHLFILGKVGKKKVFGDILERKNAFLDYKNKKQKNRKIAFFPKGSVHSFGQQMGFFPPFYFWQKRQEKVFGDILQRKNAFLDYKNKKQKKKSKNWPFSTVVSPWFWSKNGIFSTFSCLAK